MELIGKSEAEIQLSRIRTLVLYTLARNDGLTILELCEIAECDSSYMQSVLKDLAFTQLIIEKKQGDAKRIYKT